MDENIRRSEISLLITYFSFHTSDHWKCNLLAAQELEEVPALPAWISEIRQTMKKDVLRSRVVTVEALEPEYQSNWTHGLAADGAFPAFNRSANSICWAASGNHCAAERQRAQGLHLVRHDLLSDSHFYFKHFALYVVSLPHFTGFTESQKYRLLNVFMKARNWTLFNSSFESMRNLRLFFYSEDGDSVSLRNSDNCPLFYAVSHARSR